MMMQRSRTRSFPRAKLTGVSNCYLRIPHCIKGIVPPFVLERLQKCYCQNVVRLFIAVGQSLHSMHFRAMYGHNFAFFDPNIWYNEEEIRKQIEQLNGSCILTGQETPGTNRKLKEDLFKKNASADGIADRKPYGFKTRMIHLLFKRNNN